MTVPKNGYFYSYHELFIASYISDKLTDFEHCALPVSFKCFVPFGVTDGSEWFCYDDLLHGFGYGQKLPQVLDADIVAVTDFFFQLFDQTHE